MTRVNHGRCRGTRSRYSVDTILSVQNKNFSGDGKAFTKVSRAVRKAESFFTLTIHWSLAPHRSETNGIAERAVRRVKDGTSAVLLQSGLDEKLWADSMECYCYVRNVQDFLADGKTPHERRFGEPFTRPAIPVGALVEYHPSKPKDKARIHQFGKKV